LFPVWLWLLVSCLEHFPQSTVKRLTPAARQPVFYKQFTFTQYSLAERAGSKVVNLFANRKMFIYTFTFIIPVPENP
jgi:hypothetical protein